MPTDTLVLIPVVALLLGLAALFLPPAWRSRGALLGAAIATIATTTMLASNGQPLPEAEVAERPIAEPAAEPAAGPVTETAAVPEEGRS